MDKKEILKWVSIVVLILAVIYFLISVGGFSTGNVVGDDSAYIDSEEVVPGVYGEKRPDAVENQGCSFNPFSN